MLTSPSPRRKFLAVSVIWQSLRHQAFATEHQLYVYFYVPKTHSNSWHPKRGLQVHRSYLLHGGSVIKLEIQCVASQLLTPCRLSAPPQLQCWGQAHSRSNKTKRQRFRCRWTLNIVRGGRGTHGQKQRKSVYVRANAKTF